MLLHALDNNGDWISVHQATKGIPYFCPGCKSSLFLRKGIWRKSHFYHSDTKRICRLQGKTLYHLQAQWALLNLIGNQEACVEKRFIEIDRIADLVWDAKKLVFEIQYSPITGKEVRQRIADYQSMGYSVIWIFHDRTFNRKRLTEAEAVVSGYPHYFTNIDQEGRGGFYDCLTLRQEGIRTWRSKRYPVDLSSPIRIEKFFDDIPAFLKGRFQLGNIYFRGDLYDQFQGNTKIREFFLKMCDQRSVWIYQLKNVFSQILESYDTLFKVILEKCCR
ncbi:MAG: hypothetical protein Tsb0021_10520 [Chlamydiales bacterium]